MHQLPPLDVPLDRATAERQGDGHDESPWLLPMWRGRFLLDEREAARAVLLPAHDALAHATVEVKLGRYRDRVVVAFALPGAEAFGVAPDGLAWRDLRLSGSLLPAGDASLLAYARGVLYWHKRHPFCAGCGAATRVASAGHVRYCAACDRKHFPRTDPAIMMLLTRGERCLLARQPSWPAGMYSVLAGFVEPGETLEQAARRETLEEVGIAAGPPRYLASQGWPFPASLMIGFCAEAHSETITLHDDELEDARWFSRDDLASPDGFFVPPPYSLARQLIDAFIRGQH